jgi:hypothetical protein
MKNSFRVSSMEKNVGKHWPTIDGKPYVAGTV